MKRAEKCPMKTPAERRRLFPCFIAVDDVPPLVIGNAASLEAKIRLLLKFAPRVDLVTDLRPAARLGRDDRICVLDDVACRQAHDLIAGRPLIILDTGDAALNAALSATAKAAGVPVNVPDNTALCSAYLGSIVDRAPVLIAISTAGAAPVLGQRIRARIETMLPAGFGRIAGYLERRRVDLRALSPARRRIVQHRIVDGPAADHIVSGNEDAANDLLARLISGEGDGDTAQVKIVDIGDGDPGLLSLRGVETIRNADIIVHEADIAPAILDLARREARFVTVPSSILGEASGEASGNDLLDDLLGIETGTRGALLLPMRPSPDMEALMAYFSGPGGANNVIPAAMPPNTLPNLPPGLPPQKHRRDSQKVGTADMSADRHLIGQPSGDGAAPHARGPAWSM
jgi:uroporphyrin-III C-methyltransferase/precorrin-2 dehydrogenase/sirohydrochlorin ferrochelatase